MKVGPKSSLRPFLHRALQFSFLRVYYNDTLERPGMFLDKGILVVSFA